MCVCVPEMQCKNFASRTMVSSWLAEAASLLQLSAEITRDGKENCTKKKKSLTETTKQQIYAKLKLKMKSLMCAYFNPCVENLPKYKCGKMISLDFCDRTMAKKYLSMCLIQHARGKIKWEKQFQSFERKSIDRVRLLLSIYLVAFEWSPFFLISIRS